MTVMGIDPGLERTGFGLVRHERGNTTLVDYGCILTSKKLSLATRLVEVAYDIKTLLGQHRPDAVVFEELYFSKNVTSGMKVSHSRGVIMELCEEYGIPIYEINPMKVKMAVAGHGRAKKPEIKKMVRMLLHMKQEIKSDDAADALACALSFTTLGHVHT